MYTCTHTHIYIPACMQAGRQAGIHAHVPTYINLHTYIHSYTHNYIHACMRTHTNMHTHVHAYMLAYIQVCMHRTTQAYIITSFRPAALCTQRQQHWHPLLKLCLKPWAASVCAYDCVNAAGCSISFCSFCGVCKDV